MQVIAGSSPRRRRRASRLQPYIIIRNNGISITDARYGGSVTRATIALQFNHATSSYTQVASGVDRCNHDVYSSGLGTWCLNYRLAGEPQRTNSALGSCSFADGTYWAGNGSFTISTKASCIPGQTAYRHLGTGISGGNRNQAIGVFVSGQTDVAGQIFEQDATAPAAVSDVYIYDATAGAVLAQVILTWATMTLTTGGTPAAYGYQNLGIGPNGQQMVLLWVTGTGTASGTGKVGNTRTMIARPNAGSVALTATILHHSQFEANALFPSTPVVTGAATATRNAEIVTVPIPAVAIPTGGVSLYAKYVDLGMSVVQGCPVTLGNLASNMSAASYYSSGTIVGLTQDSAGNQERPSPIVAGNYGDLNEVRLVVAPTGTALLGVAVNAGVEAHNGPTAAPASWTGPWHDAVVHLNVANAGQGSYALGTFILAAGAPSLAQFRSM